MTKELVSDWQRNNNNNNKKHICSAAYKIIGINCNFLKGNIETSEGIWASSRWSATQKERESIYKCNS